MKSSMRKRWLKSCVLSLLTIGVVGVGGISHAEVIDMTTPDNANGVQIADPAAEVNNIYSYSWNKANKTLTGGVINVGSNKNGNYISLHLRLKESDFESLEPSDIKEATQALAGKVINKLPKDRYHVTAYVEIVGSDGTVLRKYDINTDHVNFDYDSQSYPSDTIGKLSDLTSALYRTTLEADAQRTEYDLGADGKLFLAYGDGYIIQPDHSKKRKDHIYTGIRGGEKDLILSHKREASTSNNELKIISDTTNSGDRRAEAYGIYHDGKGKITIESSKTDILVKGNVSKGIVVGNEFANEKSHLFLGGRDGTYSITVESDEDEEAVGIEAKLQGVIQFRDPGVKANIDVKKGLGLYAHDRGQILWADNAGAANLKTNGFGTAVLAETGGIIKARLGDVEGDIRTDEDEKSLVTANVMGSFTGNAVGHVNLTVNGNWSGNFNSTKDLIIGSNGVWGGSSANESINSLKMDSGALWNIPDLVKIPSIGTLTGSKSSVKRSYINMGKADLHIDKLSGQFTFSYQHDKNAPDTILGGEVHIKKAEPLITSQEGIGTGSDTKTEYSSVNSTVTISTSAEGIDISNHGLVESVLERLANKVYYLGVLSGENQLKGTVEIEEGLTSASVAKSLSDVDWDKSTGQGHKAKLIQYPYSALIFGNPKYDKEYEKNIKKENGKLIYRFDNDTTIINKMTKDPRSFGWGGLYIGTINNFGDDKYAGGFGAESSQSKGGPSYTIDMTGHDLHIQTDISPEEGTTGSQPMWTSAGIAAYREGTITFDNPGAININTNINYYYGSGIRVSTAQPTDHGSHVIINNDNKPEHAVKIRGGISSAGYEMNYRALEVFTQPKSAGNSIIIKGLVDIETEGGAATMFARENGSYISVGGGRLIAKNYDSMWTNSEKARIDVNMITDADGNVTDAGNNPVEIEGHATTMTTWYGTGGIINIGLTTGDSKFTGEFAGAGTQNMWLRNGAVWNNTGIVYNPWSGSNYISDISSHVTWLHGGNDKSSAGNIIQNSASDLYIDNLDGCTKLFMEHDLNYVVPEFAKNPDGSDKVDKDGNKIKNEDAGQKKIFGKLGNVIIAKAHKREGKNSEISLITDNKGLPMDSVKAEDKNRVSEVLNELANKLYYEAYAKGENNLTGKVEIAEGLTAQSASMRVEDITYKKETGQGQYLYTPAVDPKLPKTITKHGQGKTIGYYVGDDKKETWNEDVVVDVSGSGVANGKENNNVTGIYLLDGGQVTVNGNLKLTLRNAVPATRGASLGADVAHYYMSGIYAGYGGKTGDGSHGDSKFTVNGNVDMDVTGVALQANKDGFITVRGGKIKTHEIKTSETYAMLAEEGSVFMNTGTNGNEPGMEDVEVYGNLGVINKNYGYDPNPGNHASLVSIALTTSKSKLTGGVLNEFAENGNNPHQSGIDIYLKNGGLWENRWIGTERAAAVQKRENKDSYLYTGSKVRKLIGGASEAERGIIHQKENKPITVENYNGYEMVYYDHSSDGNIIGGDFVVKHAGEGSHITLRTDNKGLNTSSTKAADKNLVSATLNKLANKLYYEAYTKGEKNLTGKVEIAEGLTAQSASQRIEDITYKDANGQGQYLYTPATEDDPNPNPNPNPDPNPNPNPNPDPNPNPNPNPDPNPNPNPNPDPKPPIIYGSKETQMMKGAKTAMTSAVLLWRGNNNDLQRRMGDIRLAKEENGIWARYLGGKNELDKKNASFKQTYNIAQVGYDKKKGNWTIGAALDYGTGKDTYANGTGKEKLASLALYGAMQKEDGQYLDIILRGSRIKNDYTVYNEMNHRLDGKYRTGGLSVSVEYGKRIARENGFYIDPSIELTAGHLGGKDYDAVSDYAGGKKMHIHQDGINSVIGRIGLGIGKETERSNLFAKIALAHEFGGKVKSIFSAENEPTSGTEVDLKDSWVDVEVGGSWLVNRNTYLYGTYTRNFGADVSSKWRIDAGIRFSF